MSLTTGDILKVVVTMAFGDGNVIQNVFALLLSGAGSPWDELDILDDIESWIDAAYGQITSYIDDDLAGTDIDAYVWDPVDLDFDDIGNEPWGWTPTSTGDPVPRGVAGLVIAPTTDADVQGKKYVGGLTEDLMTEGTLTGTMLAALAAWAAIWIDPFVGVASSANFTPGVWSTVLSDLVPFKEAYSVGAILAYQRRRKRGVGI